MDPVLKSVQTRDDVKKEDKHEEKTRWERDSKDMKEEPMDVDSKK